MVRYRYSDSVQIQVSGPKSILPKPIMVVGRLGMTWLHFLNSMCGLKLDSNSDYYICTSTYSTTTPESGWTANLNDQIKIFIDNYSRKRAKYCIRLHTGSEPDFNESIDQDVPVDNDDETEEEEETRETETATITPWAPATLKNPTPTKTAPVRKFASIVPITPAKLRALQTITPIQPVLPQQQESRNGREHNSQTGAGPSSSTLNPRKRPVESTSERGQQSISELRIGSGRRNGNTQNAATSEPSPPKLTRFDDIEQPEASTSTAASRNMPGTSFTSGAGTSIALNRKRRISHPPRRYEEDSFGLRIETTRPVTLNFTSTNQAGRDNPLGEELNEAEYFQRLEIEDDSFYEGVDDNASMLTAASVEENEMRQSGINTQLDIKSMIEGKLDRFDNDMLHRIRREIMKMKRNGSWGRNVKRSPLACYLLTEVFKE